MDINRFSFDCQSIISDALEIAIAHGNTSIETWHLAYALIENDTYITPHLLQISQGKLGEKCKESIDKLPKNPGQEPRWTAELGALLEQSIFNTKKDALVDECALWLSIFDNSPALNRAMKAEGIERKTLLERIKMIKNNGNKKANNGSINTKSLDRYAVNLNDSANTGKLDPIIGRDTEIRRVIQILSRRTKNNPILIGEPGVGKTAVAEGIAQRIVNGDVPENLIGKQLYSLDMGSLVAGAKYKGEFEERLKSVIKEVIDSDGEVLLFIDEIHTLVGAGGTEGGTDAANLLKPALARGELHAIGATTLNEYQRYFEKDKALERRFQKVLIDEPDKESAIAILRGIKERYENHHKVLIKDEAIISAVELSTRYISDRRLPDKAIDLIDEAASKLRMEMNSKPVELDDYDRKILQLEIEKAAIKREKNTEKMSKIDIELADLEAERNKLAGKWESEKRVISAVQEHKEKIESIKQEAERMEREGDFGKVAELRYGKLVEEQELLKEAKVNLEKLDRNSMLLKEEVDTEEIAEVVAAWTGIPVSKMLQTEKDKLLVLETLLRKRVVGQDAALESVADAVRRSRAGLQDEKKPIGSFLFLGSTGVGKTELAKALSEYMFNDESSMTRIDMSEYQEAHSVSRLVGPPPGYVGYEEGGQLTEAIRTKPYSVILLDEIEKAHPNVYNTLLQVLDDGHLTDSKGREVNFKNTIIIMTSNLGSDLIQSAYENTDNLQIAYEKSKKSVFEILKSALKPEFLNRIDELIVFKPLDKSVIKKIAGLQLEQLKIKLLTKNIVFDYTSNALDHLSKLGFDPQYGARPIKRVIQRDVLNAMSKKLLAEEIKYAPYKTVLDCFEKQLVFRTLDPENDDQMLENL